jgi:hypothetical protein
LATSFASRVDATGRSKNSLDHQLPPLIHGASELRIDITPMLLHGALVMDQTAFDFITSNKYSKTQFLARQLADFREAGLLELRNFSVWNADERELLDRHREQALVAQRDFWLTELRNTVRWWEDNAANYAEAYGSELMKESSVPWAVGAVLDQIGTPYKAKEVRRVREAIFTDQSDEDRAYVDISLGAVLNYTNANRLNGERFRATVYDWNDMQDFMTAHDRIVAAHRHARLQHTRSMVTDLALIDPNNLTSAQVIAMLKDRRIEAFRTYIEERAQRGWSQALAEKDALYRALLDHNVKLMDRDSSKIILRLATAAISGALDIFSDVLTQIALAPGIVKTTDEFIKSTLADTALEVRPPSSEALRAIYAIRRHAAA